MKWVDQLTGIEKSASGGINCKESMAGGGGTFAIFLRPQKVSETN